MPKRDATCVKSRRRSGTDSASPSAWANWTRMKKVRLSGSSNCWLCTIVHCRSTRNPATAYTMPGVSGQDSMRTYCPAERAASAVAVMRAPGC